ncbi:MAG: esterase family protein [Muribaculaceae bacterium]|nr:esterase family protein [Muribaculaceae bacterium]
MKRSHYLFLTLCLMVALVAPQAAARDVAFLQTDTVEVPAQKMNRSIKVAVVVPHQYRIYPDTKYPVVYLLHGAWGCYRDWPHKANLDSLADTYSTIIVCPDGQDSWYLDSPIDPSFQFETFISYELVNYIDTHYRTYPRREMRAITGLSMGGHGALWNAFRHPDVFASCGSMSGGVDISKFPGRWHIADRLGDYDNNQQRWIDHSVISLVPTLEPGQNIIIDIGYDDLFFEVNNNLHEALLQQGVEHDYTVRHGDHNWQFWVNSIDYHMMFFHKIFAAEQ